jgi:sarcosine oxidase subunit gamma
VTVEIRQVDLAQVDLRSNPRDVPFDPPEPNTATDWNGWDVLWLGPDEWLLVGETGAEGAIERASSESLGAAHRSIVAVSANRIAFDLIDGPEPLSTGCSLDLDPTRWRPGMCAQTLFGRAQVIIHQLDERTTRVFVRPSFATYVLARLEGAGIS